MEDLAGVVLNKRYQIERFLGSGGMAEVFRAKDVDAPHYYAIKIIREQLLEHPNLVIRFEDEADRLKNLQHPNIVRFYDFVTSDGFTYIVMEYIDGYPLSRLLRLRRQRGEGPTPIEESVRILAQIARALARVHEQGLVHRDVKPGNILIRQTDGAAFLTDMGIAKDLTRGAVTHTLVGTFAYLAPEQILRQAVSPATDIYALGTVAYYLFAGRRPFEAPVDQELDTIQREEILIEQHLRRLPLPPSTHNPYLPPALDAALGRALAKLPEARYPNVMAFMHQVHDALRPLLPGEMQVLKEIDAEPIRLPSHTARASRRRRGSASERRSRQWQTLLRIGAGVAVVAVILIVLAALTRGTPSGTSPGASPRTSPAATTQTTVAATPNLTVTTDWLTLEAERLALQASETALAQALSMAASETTTATVTPTETASATASTTPSATASPTASPTATQTRTPTPSVTASPTASPTATQTQTPTEMPDLRATQRALEATSTELARTLSAPLIVTSTRPAVGTATTPPGDTLATPTSSATPNRAAAYARATLSVLSRTSTPLALTVAALPTDTPTPTPSPTLTPSPTTTPTVAATPTPTFVDWCKKAVLLRDATGLDETDDLVEEGINEEALQQYLVERDTAPLDPDDQPPACMAYIDRWLYPRLITAAQANFAAAYDQFGDDGEDASEVANRHAERARRYLDYAAALQPDDPNALTLHRCVDLLSQLDDPIKTRDAITALRALAEEAGTDLSVCEPTLGEMWEAAATAFPEVTNRPLATVNRSDDLYDFPGRNRIGVLGAGVQVAVLGQTDVINDEYWLLVELEDGQKGYLLRDALDWEGDLEMEMEGVPTVVPPPRPP